MQASCALSANGVHGTLLKCAYAFKAGHRPCVTRSRTSCRGVQRLPRQVLLGQSHPNHQQQRRLELTLTRAAEEPQPSTFDYEEPETAKEGIDLGLVMCKQGRWSDALGIFEKSLKLPGTGVKRFRDKPRLVSDGEKMALLYNIACCHSQLQDARSGLVALAGCMEAGYSDFGQVRSDPDLEFLRADSRFEGLMERFEKKAGGFLGFDLSGLFGQK